MYFFGEKEGKYYSSDREEKVIIDAEAIEETFIEEYISKIKKVSLGSDGQMKEAIENLIIVLSNIDLYLSKHPEKDKDFKELADFYLPEIIDNMITYSEVVDADYNVESKEKLRSSLLETLNLVSNAFSTILNELYDNIALNVSASLEAVKASIRMKGLSR